MEDIAQVCYRKDIFVISDEIYSELSYKEPHVSIASSQNEERTIINGFQGICHDRMETGVCMHEYMEQMIKFAFAIMCAPTTSQYDIEAEKW